MERIPGAPEGEPVPAPPAGSIPPAPDAPAPPSSTPAPTPPARRSRVGLIAVIVVAVVVVGGIAAALAGGGDAETADPSPSATSPSGAPTETSTASEQPAGTVPDEIGGAPRITGATGDAFEELMRGFAEQDTLAVGVYGTMQAPSFMYVVLGTAEDMEGLPLEAFLDLMAAGGSMAIQGDVATRTEGPVDAVCGSTDDASLAYMCVTIDDGSVDALFGFEDAPPDEQLDIAIAAA
jgi:hypothetical protein